MMLIKIPFTKAATQLKAASEFPMVVLKANRVLSSQRHSSEVTTTNLN